MPKTTPRRSGPGQPPKISQRAPDGNGTIADAIVRRLTAGAYMEHAAAAAGVHRSTAFGWLRVGAELRSKILAGDATRSALKAFEVACVEFSEQADEAEAAWFVTAEEQLDRAARGGTEDVTTTDKYDASGSLTERIVVTKRLPPDPKVTEWRLERKAPDLYGRRTAVDVGGQADNPVKVEAVSVAGLLDALDDAGE